MKPWQHAEESGRAEHAEKTNRAAAWAQRHAHLKSSRRPSVPDTDRQSVLMSAIGSRAVRLKAS